MHVPKMSIKKRIPYNIQFFRTIELLSFPFQSVCCIDGLHCCPAGTTCDIGTGTCSRSYIQLNWMVKESTSNAKTAATVRQLEGTDIPEEPAITVGNVPCGGSYSCPDGNTCCKSSGVWKCCPYPQVGCMVPVDQGNYVNFMICKS